MMFMLTSFWKCANRRNRDPNPLGVLAAVAGGVAGSAATHAGRFGSRETEALRRRHRGIQESHRARAHSAGRLRQSGPGLHGAPGLWGRRSRRSSTRWNCLPSWDPRRPLLGYALLAQGYNAEAIPHLEKVHEQTALGIAQIGAGRLQRGGGKSAGRAGPAPQRSRLALLSWPRSELLSKQSIDTLLAAYPDSARAHQALAENYYVLRQMPQAEKEFLEALRLRPDTPELHLELGLVYAGSAQWPKAEEQFRARTKLQPRGNAEGAYRFGTALLQPGKAREARIELRRADRLQPDMPETLYSLGKAAALAGDPPAAEKAWMKLLTIEKASDLAAQTHFALAGLYRKQGKTADAERETREFQKMQECLRRKRHGWFAVRKPTRLC